MNTIESPELKYARERRTPQPDDESMLVTHQDLGKLRQKNLYLDDYQQQSSDGWTLVAPPAQIAIFRSILGAKEQSK